MISVIITTRNEQRHIRKCLNSLKNQDYPRSKIEIIVVDNNSTDKTQELVKNFQLKFPRLDLKMFNAGPERSAQRNFGVVKSHGEYFIYLDADMTLCGNVIGDCVEKIKADPEINTFYLSEIVMGKSFWNRVRRFERSFYDGTVIDAARFIKKSIFFMVGGFDENLYACEDWDLDKRLKKFGQPAIIKRAIYHDERKFKLIKYIRKKIYYTRNFEKYIGKWGKDEPDIKKQFGFSYRFLGVFTENGKWKKLLSHPVLTLGMYFLRVVIGFNMLLIKIRTN